MNFDFSYYCMVISNQLLGNTSLMVLYGCFTKENSLLIQYYFIVKVTSMQRYSVHLTYYCI